MHWYAEDPSVRTRQVLLDVAGALWLLVWLGIGAVHSAVAGLAAPGRALEDSGTRLADSLSGAAGQAGGAPLLGEALARVGVAEQNAVGTLALVLAVLLAGIPILWAVQRWLTRRLAFAREHRAAVDLHDDVELWALRAALTRPLDELATLGRRRHLPRRQRPDPARRRGPGRAARRVDRRPPLPRSGRPDPLTHDRHPKPQHRREQHQRGDYRQRPQGAERLTSTEHHAADAETPRPRT